MLPEVGVVTSSVLSAFSAASSVVAVTVSGLIGSEVEASTGSPSWGAVLETAGVSETASFLAFSWSSLGNFWKKLPKMEVRLDLTGVSVFFSSGFDSSAGASKITND